MKLPSYIQIEPVGQCNLRCQMCPIQFRRDGPPYGPLAFMPFEKFTQLVDQFVGLKELQLQGLGEPMMHPQFFDMVDYTASRGIRVTTNSNLTLLNQARAERCVRSGLEILHVSIDGSTPETYERIRVRSRLEKVVRNLGLLREASLKTGLAGPRLHLVMVIMRQNLHELPDLVRFAHSWNMEEIFVQHLCHDFTEESLPAHYRPMRDFVQSQTLLLENEERISEYFGQARLVAAELGITLRLPRVRPKPYLSTISGMERCDWPWRGAYISYDGYAMPCCMISTPDRTNFGNMFEEGVEAVWNGQTAQAFRQQLASGTPPEICQSCSVYAGVF
jgi:radical SAM protein with 4Fe4S-binding SPASM domain